MVKSPLISLIAALSLASSALAGSIPASVGVGLSIKERDHESTALEASMTERDLEDSELVVDSNDNDDEGLPDSNEEHDMSYVDDDDDDDTTPNFSDSPLEEAAELVGRGFDKNFRVYRQLWHTRTCTNVCWDNHIDRLAIDHQCYKGRCGARYLMDTNLDKNLCNRKFKVCDKEYQLKYTGKRWSCGRFSLYNRKGHHFGKKYANIVRKGKKVGGCWVWNKVRVAKHCTAGPFSFYSVLRCKLN